MVIRAAGDEKIKLPCEIQELANVFGIVIAVIDLKRFQAAAGHFLNERPQRQGLAIRKAHGMSERRQAAGPANFLNALSKGGELALDTRQDSVRKITIKGALMVRHKFFGDQDARELPFPTGDYLRLDYDWAKVNSRLLQLL